MTVNAMFLEEPMFVSVGWFCLVGGVWGAVKIARAKKLYRSDFKNLEGVITEEDRKTEVTLTPLQRWAIVVCCAGLAAIGLFVIEHDHNWNPFLH